MPQLTRRAFVVASASAAAAYSAGGAGTRQVDETLRSGIARRKIPAAVAMFADNRGVLYSGAYGTRDDSGAPVTVDSIFNIASMGKAITTVAALQLVEQGKVSLSEPVARHLPQLAGLDVLDGFDEAGKPKLRPAKTPITLKHLLTHTCGLCYDFWDADAFRYSSSKIPNYTKPGPLMFEPGARWQYGLGTDWAGRLVEKLSGANLEDYFQQNILKPLGMNDTSYILPESKFDRMVSTYGRDASGELKQNDRKMPQPPKAFSGGGGEYSTVGDYVKFMQMILNRGAGPNNVRILKPQTVDLMMTNQIGDISAGKMKSFRSNLSADVDIQPGHKEGWTLGFLINNDAYPGGRSAGSLAWAGLFNTFYWIDPKRRRCGVIMMQYLPFVDKEAVGLLDDFEKAAYRNL